jgi:putative transposase
MKRKRFTEEQIIGVLREHDAGAKAADLARRHGISEYGGMDVSDAKRLRSLEEENRKLKKLLAESILDQAALKELLAKKWFTTTFIAGIPELVIHGEHGWLVPARARCKFVSSASGRRWRGPRGGSK